MELTLIEYDGTLVRYSITTNIPFCVDAVYAELKLRITFIPLVLTPEQLPVTAQEERLYNAVKWPTANSAVNASGVLTLNLAEYPRTRTSVTQLRFPCDVNGIINCVPLETTGYDCTIVNQLAYPWLPLPPAPCSNLVGAVAEDWTMFNFELWLELDTPINKFPLLSNVIGKLYTNPLAPVTDAACCQLKEPSELQLNFEDDPVVFATQVLPL
jgi:hypothetical protein